jgi:hypothetical protein
MKKTLIVALCVLAAVGSARATAWSSTTLRADWDTLDACMQRVYALFGDPNYASSYGANVGTIYSSFYGLQTSSVDGWSVSDQPTARLKAIVADGFRREISTGWSGSPFFVGGTAFQSYCEGIRAGYGISAGTYWYRNVYDSIADTARVGWAVGSMARHNGIGAFMPITVQPRPGQILAEFTVIDSSYTDSTELNTTIAGGGLLEAYVATAITVTSLSNACTLNLTISGKDFNGSNIKTTVYLDSADFPKGSAVNIGAIGTYFVDVTAVDCASWKGYSAITGGKVDIRTRKDR